MAIKIKTHSYDITRNTTGGRATPRYIVMHYTATHNATANNELLYFATNPAATNASADFFVDDNDVIQYNTQLGSRYSWAVGDGNGGTFGKECNNTNQISIEMSCHQSGGRWYINEATYKNAVELVRYLMPKYGITADRVIRHFDVSRKLCPNAIGWLAATGDESTWKKFKAAISGNAQEANVKPAENKPVNTPIYRVRKSASDSKSQIGAYAVLANAKKQADAHAGYSVFDGTGKLVYSPDNKKKSIDEIAREVIAGKWGNGNARKLALANAGYDYATVQKKVNELLR